MTINRVINGVQVEIELTPEEMQEAYNAEHYAEGGEWFGKVRWCNDDLESALAKDGFATSEKNIAELRAKCDHHSFQDLMVSAGWDFIHSMIDTLNSEDKLDFATEDEDEEADEYEWGATEVCPHCEAENFYPEWDTEQQGYVAVCQDCGEEILLCDACRHADDNPDMDCDWHKTACGGECFRGKTTLAEYKAT